MLAECPFRLVENAGSQRVRDEVPEPERRCRECGRGLAGAVVLEDEPVEVVEVRSPLAWLTVPSAEQRTGLRRT